MYKSPSTSEWAWPCPEAVTGRVGGADTEAPWETEQTAIPLPVRATAAQYTTLDKKDKGDVH